LEETGKTFEDKKLVKVVNQAKNFLDNHGGSSNNIIGASALSMSS